MPGLIKGLIPLITQMDLLNGRQLLPLIISETRGGLWNQTLPAVCEELAIAALTLLWLHFKGRFASRRWVTVRLCDAKNQTHTCKGQCSACSTAQILIISPASLTHHHDLKQTCTKPTAQRTCRSTWKKKRNMIMYHFHPKLANSQAFWLTSVTQIQTSVPVIVQFLNLFQFERFFIQQII